MLSDPTIIKQGNEYAVSHGSDAGLHAVFSLEPILDDEQTAEQGRPIYRDIEMITIHVVGDNTRIIKRPINKQETAGAPSDIHRFPKQWEFFQNQNIDAIDGLPITEWVAITKGMALMLKGLNIHSVEQLAACRDEVLGKMLDGYALRDKARAFLAQGTDSAAILGMQAQLADALNQIEALKNQRLGTEEEIKRRPGRPVKEVADA